LVSTTRPVHRPDGLFDHGIGVLTDLAIGNDVVEREEVEIINLGARHEFVNVDRSCGFKRDVFPWHLFEQNRSSGVIGYPRKAQNELAKRVRKRKRPMPELAVAI
jgi:hypothetical protein